MTKELGFPRGLFGNFGQNCEGNVTIKMGGPKLFEGKKTGPRKKHFEVRWNGGPLI